MQRVTLNTDPSFRGRMFWYDDDSTQQFGSMVGPVFASIVSTYVGISYGHLVLLDCSLYIWAFSLENYLKNMNSTMMSHR